MGDDATSGLAYTGYDEASNTIFVSFRGTVATKFRNWWSDLSSIKLVSTELCQAPDCMVGEGFLTAYEGLKSHVVGAVKKLRQATPRARTTITGHSLGAALATICAMDLS